MIKFPFFDIVENMRDKVSVITPCLNILKSQREVIFQKMMASIRQQSHRNIEHIVIDGKSQDGTLDLLKKYLNQGLISKLVSEPDSGIYQAINKGIQLSTGDYINIMNTDDYFINPDFFKRAIKLIEKNQADFYHANRLIISSTNNPPIIKRGNEKTAFFRMPFRHQTMVVKKEVFDEIGLFDEKYKIASDYKWVMQMLLADKKGIYDPKTEVCSKNGGISSNRQECIREISQIIYECYGKRYKLSPNDCKSIYLRNFSLPLLWKILFYIKNTKIKKSLLYGLNLKIKKCQKR